MAARIAAAFVHAEVPTRRPFLASAATTSVAAARRASSLPLGSLQWVRKRCFTRPRSPEPSIVVPESDEAITDLLRRNDFAPGWMVSYNYRDEILNLRRIERIAHPSGLDRWQVHIRGYDHPDGIELTAHFEPEPRRHPRAHVTLFGLDVDRGMDALLELLDHHRMDYQWLDGPPDP